MEHITTPHNISSKLVLYGSFSISKGHLAVELNVQNTRQADRLKSQQLADTNYKHRHAVDKQSNSASGKLTYQFSHSSLYPIT